MFHSLPNSAWADRNWAEAAGQMGKKVKHPNQSQPNPGPRPDESPCCTDLAYGVDRGEHVDRPHGLGHAVLCREEVEVEDAAVVLDDHGLVAEEGDALELEERVVERVREHVARPLGHHDGDHDEQQLE